MLVIVRANRLLASARKAAASGDRGGAATLVARAYALLGREPWVDLTPLELNTISQVCRLWFELTVHTHRAEARAMLRRAVSAIEQSEGERQFADWLTWAKEVLAEPDVLPPPSKKRR